MFFSSISAVKDRASRASLPREKHRAAKLAPREAPQDRRVRIPTGATTGCREHSHPFVRAIMITKSSEPPARGHLCLLSRGTHSEHAQCMLFCGMSDVERVSALVRHSLPGCASDVNVYIILGLQRTRAIALRRSLFETRTDAKSEGSTRTEKQNRDGSRACSQEHLLHMRMSSGKGSEPDTTQRTRVSDGQVLYPLIHLRRSAFDEVNDDNELDDEAGDDKRRGRSPRLLRRRRRRMPGWRDVAELAPASPIHRRPGSTAVNIPPGSTPLR